MIPARDHFINFKILLFTAPLLMLLFFFLGGGYVCFTLLCFCCTVKSISYVYVCIYIYMYIFPPSWTCLPFPFTTGTLDVLYLCLGQAWIPIPYYCRNYCIIIDSGN